jgi:hypothetical protein
MGWFDKSPKSCEIEDAEEYRKRTLNSWFNNERYGVNLSNAEKSKIKYISLPYSNRFEYEKR